MSSREHPIPRPTARVILVDGEGRVLLFRASMVDEATGRPFWFMAGGGLEDGESFEEAAVRELYEETGLRGLELGPLAWLRDHTWEWQGDWITSVERYFLVRTASSAIEEAYRTDLELQVLVEHRWWSASELAETADLLVPRDLASLLPPLLAGEVPAEPLRVV